MLDGLASGLERIGALLTWRDPVATTILVATWLLSAVLAWTLGMPAMVAAVVLFDMRPPFIRDPFPPPPANLLSVLPTRSDLMM